MFLQFVINGLITGVLYTIMAIGFSLVYNTTHIFHIAAAAVYVVAAYVFWFCATTLCIPILLAAFVSVICSMGISILIEVIVYRPLEKKNASLNIKMVSSIGVMTVLVNLLALFFGNETKVIDVSISRSFHFGELVIMLPQVYQAVIGICVIILFFFFISHSNIGLKIKAASDNDSLYEVLGYSVHSLRDVVFLLSGALIAIASCLTAYDVGLNPDRGMIVLVNAMVAMIIGGIGRFSTCVVGGLVLGLLQSLSIFYFSSNWQNAVSFVILLLFLFLRPQGIAGYKRRMV